MKRPQHLQKGDKIAIVATARKAFPEELEYAIKLVESWGLEVVLGDSIDTEFHQFGGTDEHRAMDFQKQMDNPEIKAIWIARGGYGSVRILDKLDFSNFTENPKWIIGYSDITVLHTRAHNLGVQSLHAQMPVAMDTKTPESAESLRKLLFGEPYSMEFQADNPLNKEGTAEGILIGGNLSMLYSICGSDAQVDTQDKILFIEDLDEYLYHIDRMMQNLKRNGMLKNIKALLVGGMTEMHDNAIPFGFNAQEIVSQYIDQDIPLVFDFPAGHIENNLALKFGAKVSLSLKNKNFKLDYI